MAKELAGDARISFEGKLSPSRLAALPGASDEQIRSLRRNTTYPIQDFVVLPLEPDTLPAIVAEASVELLQDNVLHVHIEKAGELVFVACDRFHPDVTWCGALIDEGLLERLREQGILNAFTASDDSS